MTASRLNANGYHLKACRRVKRSIGSLETFLTSFVVYISMFELWTVNASISSPAWTNVALNKPAYQIDQHSDSSPDKAVDGNSAGNVPRTCAHTYASRGAWWEVDLGSTYVIDHVTLFNKQQGDWGKKLHDVHVNIGHTREDYVSRGFHAGSIGISYTFQIRPPISGRWVRITRDNESTRFDQLVLCEVQVFVTSNVAIRFERGLLAIGTGALLESAPAKTKTACCLLCKMTTNCSAVNFYSGICETLSAATTANDTNDNLYFFRYL